MKELKDDELKSINGGFSLVSGLTAAGLVIFLVGVFDGYTRPLKCNE